MLNRQILPKMISGTVGVMERVIGIDFGARNCVSAVYCSGVRILFNILLLSLVFIL